MTKPKAVKKPVIKTDKSMERIVELSDRMNYVVKMLQEHAEEIITIRSKLDQVRNRMGI
jgi:hypothetical protein|tara:strand:+ start:3120 stop:3296 length:177 start_codon:yes stop_codon:yes gene_type:complete